MSWLSRLLGEPEARAQSAAGDPARVREVESVLAELRPLFAVDGGDFELVSIDARCVRFRARRACRACHGQATTLSQALEVRLQERCPWLEGVRPV